MELSDSAVEGVQVASSTSLEEKEFQKLVCIALNRILEPEVKEEELSASYKEALLGISTLILELARVDADGPSINSVLEECKFSPERAQFFTKKYLENKDNVRSILERVSDTPLYVVDVQWRLDYYLKNNHLEKVGRPEYLINFDTQPSLSNMQFACTQEQLQDLVLKLKDATKTLEKFIQR